MELLREFRENLGNFVVTGLADDIDQFGYEYDSKRFTGFYLDSDMSSINTAQLLIADKYNCVCLERNLKSIVQEGAEPFANEASRLLKRIEQYRKLRYKYKVISAK